MAIKSVSIRIEEEMLEKIGYVADYEGRSVNSHILVLIRDNITVYEKKHGKIEGGINPDATEFFGNIAGERLKIRNDNLNHTSFVVSLSRAMPWSYSFP